MESKQSFNHTAHAQFLYQGTDLKADGNDLRTSPPQIALSSLSTTMQPVEATQGAADQHRPLRKCSPAVQSFDYGQASDHELLDIARASDELAFEELSRRSQTSIRNRVFRIVRNREDTEDVMQETLIKAYTHLNDFRGSCCFSTWLTRIAINTALMLLRKKRSRSALSSCQLESEERTRGPWEFPDPSHDPEQIYTKCQVLDLLARAVEALPTSDRTTLELHHGRERSLRECADEVGITVAAAKSRLLRARLRLRSDLERKRILRGDLCTRSTSQSVVRGSRVRKTDALPI
jgi:RNA polymerase sigma-70 factor (ECF subfamily)